MLISYLSCYLNFERYGMRKDQVIGMIVGCAVGDALGGPYESMHPKEIQITYDTSLDMTGGGIHNLEVGEWTDDTALMLATADAYIKCDGLDATTVAENFKAWRASGKFGTRNSVVDIGATTDTAISRMTRQHPFASEASSDSSGSGSLMRIAPAIAANHNNEYAAIGDAVALALLTHGSSETVKYISAFVAELFNGKLPHYRSLRHLWHVDSPDLQDLQPPNTIMRSYNVAWYALHYGGSFEGAMIEAIRFGYDTGTNAAITGMLAGARNGYTGIPRRWLDKLHQHDEIFHVAEKLYQVGERTCKYKMFREE